MLNRRMFILIAAVIAGSCAILKSLGQPVLPFVIGTLVVILGVFLAALVGRKAAEGSIALSIRGSIDKFKQSGIWQFNRAGHAIRVFGEESAIGIFLQNAEAGNVTDGTCDAVARELLRRERKGRNLWRLLLAALIAAGFLRVIFGIVRHFLGNTN